MKVLLVVSTLNTGGAQRAFANMSLGFPKGWECDFLLNDSCDITYPYQGKIIDLGLKPKKNKTALLYQVKVFTRRFIKLKKLKKTEEYDVCISALTSANVVNILTGSCYCKTIITVRSFMSRRMQNAKGIKKFLETYAVKRIFNYADYIVPVSKSMGIDLIRNFGINPYKVKSLYNGYNLKCMEDLSEEQLSEDEEMWVSASRYTLVTAGRLSPEKGHEHLIRAFKKVNKRVPDSTLLILGEGILKSKLQNLIEELGLEGKVVLCGFVRNPYKIIKQSTVFVLPSYYEGFPNSLAESLCLGIPAVSTDCDSGAREILAPDTELDKKVKKGFETAKYGILCPVCETVHENSNWSLTTEENDMAEAILHMLENPKVYAYYQEMSKERAEQLSMNEIMKEWIQLIK